ncbi:MAG: hypothetical protein FJ147_13555 [Deltaproteobacteria bacterium]|nr:hypothetical protein [Deltaproteobacteria bacterium]
MILTRDVIVREIENRQIVITPLSLDQVGPASIDLHLGGGRKQLTAIVIDRSGEPLHKSRDERRDHCVLASV